MRFGRVGFASIIVLALTLALASCNGGGYTSTATSGTASIRFINGSPDVGGFDVLVNGKVIATNITYGQISAYQTQTVGTAPLPSISFVKTGTTTSIFPSLNASPSPSSTPQGFQLGAAPNSKLTIVIEGRAAFVGSLGLNIGAFVEPVITNTSGQYSVVFHHASPAAGVASPSGLTVGQVALGANPLYSVQGQLEFGTATGAATSIFAVTGQPQYPGPPGVGFFAGPFIIVTATPVPVSTSPTPTPSVSPTPSPLATTIYAVIVPGPPVILPTPTGNPFPVTGVDPANVNQTLPFNTDQTLAVYLIDSTSSPTGSQLIGTFNN